MKLVSSALFGVSVLLGGCAGAPRFATADYVTMESLFYTIEQELCGALSAIERDARVSAVLDDAGFTIERQFAKATVGLELVRTVDASGSVSLVIPVSGGQAGIAGDLVLSREDTVETSVSVFYPFDELQCAGRNDIANPPPRIAGGLGLREWVLNTTVALVNVEEVPAAYSYEAEFRVVRGAGARPTLRLTPRGLDSLSAGAGLGAGRETVHTIAVTISQVTLDRQRSGRVPKNVRDALDAEEGLNILRRIRSR